MDRHAGRASCTTTPTPRSPPTGCQFDSRFAAERRVTTGYVALPTHRWEITFAPADIRVRSRWGFCDLLEQIGTTDTRRVYPDFAQVARYAWLAGDRARRDDGGRRAGTARHRARQPLQCDQARRPDLTRDIYTCARD